jgi:hypothetical protein
MTIDRQLLGDIALAVLLALPTAAFARPEPLVSQETATTPMVEKAAIVERSSVERRVSLLG